MKLEKFLINKKGSVLEIGCANGIFLNEWKKMAGNVLALIRPGI